MTYRVGELDQRITFQVRQKADDGMGGSVDTWVDIPELSSVWAHARPKTGREVTEFNRVNAEVGYLFVVRNRADILPAYRIVWDGQPFSINAVKKPKSRSMYLEIDAMAGLAQ